MGSFGFQWHVTDRCNQRCAHCYQDDFSSRSELPQGSLEIIADRIFNGAAGETVAVNLTGGEPLLIPRIFDLISKMHSFSNLGELNIITNATVTPYPVLEKIGTSAKIGVLKVSLESAEERINDMIRGAGNFRKVLEGVDRLLKHTGKPVVLMVTLGKYNVGGIHAAVELAKATGISGIIFERFIPLGAGTAIMAQALDRNGWARAVNAISAAAGTEATADDLMAYRAFWLWTDGRKEGVLEGALCNLGRGSMAVMPDGTVYPCRRLPVSVGNLLRDEFSDIRTRLAGFDPQAIKCRLEGDYCGWCGVEGCAGCRALAKALSGSFLSDDPQCMLTHGGDTTS